MSAYIRRNIRILVCLDLLNLPPVNRAGEIIMIPADNKYKTTATQLLCPATLFTIIIFLVQDRSSLFTLFSEFSMARALIIQLHFIFYFAVTKIKLESVHKCDKCGEIFSQTRRHLELPDVVTFTSTPKKTDIRRNRSLLTLKFDMKSWSHLE